MGGGESGDRQPNGSMKEWGQEWLGPWRDRAPPPPPRSRTPRSGLRPQGTDSIKPAAQQAHERPPLHLGGRLWGGQGPPLPAPLPPCTLHTPTPPSQAVPRCGSSPGSPSLRPAAGEAGAGPAGFKGLSARLPRPAWAASRRPDGSHRSPASPPETPGDSLPLCVLKQRFPERVTVPRVSSRRDTEEGLAWATHGPGFPTRDRRAGIPLQGSPPPPATACLYRALQPTAPPLGSTLGQPGGPPQLCPRPLPVVPHLPTLSVHAAGFLGWGDPGAREAPLWGCCEMSLELAPPFWHLNSLRNSCIPSLWEGEPTRLAVGATPAGVPTQPPRSCVTPDKSPHLCLFL